MSWLNYTPIYQNHMGGIGFVGTAGQALDLLAEVASRFVVNGICPIDSQNRDFRGIRFYDAPFQLSADCDIIFISLESDERAVEAIFGEQGMIHTIHSGSVIINTYPNSVRLSQDLFTKLSQSGINYLDCAIFGSFKGRETGPNAVISGLREPYSAVESLFKSIFKKVTFLGLPGSATRLSLSARMIEAISTVALSEALTVCMRSGIPKESALEVLVHYINIAEFTESTGRKISDEKFAPEVRLRDFLTDIYKIEEFVRFSQSSAPLFMTSKALYESASAIGLSNLDYTAVFRVSKRIGGFL